MSCNRKLGQYDCCTVVQGDCFELMKALPDSGVDALITDPPYLVDGGTGGGCFGRRDHFRRIGGFTDGGCDFSFLARFDNWFSFCSRRQLADVLKYAMRCDRYNVITWCKPNPVPTCNNKYLPDVEFVVHGFKSGHLYGSYDDKSSFFIHPCGQNTTSHPNEKPLPLMEKLVALATVDGDTILDPFCGSGTTLVAARRLRRHYLGFEISAEYCVMARERLARIEAQPSLFDPKPEQLKLEQDV
jgi:DNA modification methylase